MALLLASYKHIYNVVHMCAAYVSAQPPVVLSQCMRTITLLQPEVPRATSHTSQLRNLGPCLDHTTSMAAWRGTQTASGR